MTTEAEWAWAAGFFEGEGTVRINKPTKHNLGALLVSAVNTDRALVEWLNDRWPGYMKASSGLRADQRPAWMWVIAARRAADFLRGIQPHLRSPRQLKRVAFGIEFQEQKRPGGGGRPTPYEYVHDQWCAYWWMAELNMRGKGRNDELILLGAEEPPI